MSTPPRIDWNDLRDVQDEIHRWAGEQFPHRTDHHAIYKLVVEEIPELMMHKKEKGMQDIGLELADCFILLMDLASMWGVELDDAIYEKMQINYARQWNMDENGIMQHVEALPQHQVTRRSANGTWCPWCKDTLNVIAAPPTSACQYKCRTCGNEFSDDIPF